ncbi:glycosyltransferase [Flavobacterium arcticum]|uniref:Glycosyltransferase n=1 Tax=Flavobacterium arcticum TaxID=1784713 RepID=A0A345HEH0_9FLAO|nr:glycosyltransferase [Flavobacterium arcticum]AXG74980.1 glycosyltransferase [Flavobacterium arcticum]KAF2506532.1 glycosyltransferase [Flavobacterium arcticum]
MSGKHIKISALAIVYNEEHNIREYLNNMSFADEIIVVDSYSDDKTPDIIKEEYPHVKFYQRKFDDFSSQRNYTLDLATHDWIAFFDADERITEKGINEILDVVRSGPEEVALWVKRVFYYQGKPLVNNNFNEDRTARIFRKSKCRYSDKLVHEKLIINGKSRVLKYAIEHYSFINKEDFLQKRLHYSRLKATEFYNEGVNTNIFHFTVRPGFRFFKYYILKFGFINGRRGYEIARILGYHVYMRYVYLREMNAARTKILVIQQKMIGDVLASSSICNTLKAEYPCSRIDYLVNTFTTPVVENNPNIDNIIPFEDGYRESKLKFFKFLKKIRKTNYDVVIDAYAKWESGIITSFSGAETKIGYKKWYTSFFYNKTIAPDKTVSGSALYHRMQLAEALTEKKHPIVYPKIYLIEQERQEAKKQMSEKLNMHLPVFMISVLGSDNIKSLPAEEMAKMIDKISDSCNAQLLFNYLPSQIEKAKEIYNLCSPKTQAKIFFDFYFKDLRSFLAVLEQCNALIGNEGGAVNMAKALDIPTFTIFSPWINKNSWNMLTENEKHTALHLKDYFPEIYGTKHPKEFKDQSLELYKKLTLNLFENDLEAFLKRIMKQAKDEGLLLSRKESI